MISGAKMKKEQVITAELPPTVSGLLRSLSRETSDSPNAEYREWVTKNNATLHDTLPLRCTSLGFGTIFFNFAPNSPYNGLITRGSVTHLSFLECDESIWLYVFNRITQRPHNILLAYYRNSNRGEHPIHYRAKSAWYGLNSTTVRGSDIRILLTRKISCMLGYVIRRMLHFSKSRLLIESPIRRRTG